MSTHTHSHTHTQTHSHTHIFKIFKMNEHGILSLVLVPGASSPRRPQHPACLLILEVRGWMVEKKQEGFLVGEAFELGHEMQSLAGPRTSMGGAPVGPGMAGGLLIPGHCGEPWDSLCLAAFFLC